MKKYTILGNPAKHSKSPELFRAAYFKYSDLSYDINEPETAEECISILKSRYDGGNITAPFKEGVFNLADETTDVAKLIGAVNMAVVLPDGKIKADNCDHYGVSESFKEFKVSLKVKSCLLLGIGGAGKAAAYAVHNAGGILTIANRTEQKAKEFADKLKCNAMPINGIAFENAVRNADIIVNTLYSDIDVIDKDWLNHKQVILDASYIGSPLLDKAKEAGGMVIDGRYWVYHQALYCFYKFTGIEPDREAMRKVVGI